MATVEAPQPKLTVERFADDGITCLKLAGTIDEAFEGKKLGASATGDALVIDLGSVKKISSFGIREWVDFIGTASKQVKRLYLIECAPKVVDQLNMVANFAGSGRVYSFYAPFRCDYCDSEHRVLLRVDKDHEAIRSMKLAERPCPSCEESMYFDDDGTTFFSYVLGQEKLALPDDIAQFLANRLDYAVAEGDRKLRIDKLIEGRVTYLRLAGNLDRSFPREKLAEGLEGQVIVDVGSVGRIEPAGAAEWRGFVQMTAPLVEALYLAAVQPAFLEKLGTRDDLGPKGQVITLTLPYTCKGCGTTSGHTIDVAEHHSVLKFATAPELRCASCKVAMHCTASEHLMTLLPALPKPTADATLVKSIGSLRERAMATPRKPTTQMAPIVAPVAAQPPRASWIVPFLASLLAVVLAATGFLLYQRFTRSSITADTVTDRSAPERPSWITNEACTATPQQGLSCIGKASARARDEAEDEASEAAYDALANAIALRITDDKWRAVVPAIYKSARDAKLAAYDRAPDSTAARRDVREARQAVMRSLRSSGAGSVPATPTARYWEQLGQDDHERYAAHAQVAIGKTELARLVESYSHVEAKLGAKVVTAFPLVAWRYPAVERGAIVVALDAGLLKDLGLAPGFIVLGLSRRDIVDAATFAKLGGEEHAKLTTSGGTLRLQVQTDDGTPREFVKEIAGAPVAPTKDKDKPGTRPTAERPSTPPGGINVWDRVGGNRGSAEAPK